MSLYKNKSKKKNFNFLVSFQVVLHPNQDFAPFLFLVQKPWAPHLQTEIEINCQESHKNPNPLVDTPVKWIGGPVDWDKKTLGTLKTRFSRLHVAGQDWNWWNMEFQNTKVVCVYMLCPISHLGNCVWPPNPKTNLSNLWHCNWLYHDHQISSISYRIPTK